MLADGPRLQSEINASSNRQLSCVVPIVRLAKDRANQWGSLELCSVRARGVKNNPMEDDRIRYLRTASRRARRASTNLCPVGLSRLQRNLRTLWIFTSSVKSREPGDAAPWVAPSPHGTNRSSVSNRARIRGPSASGGRGRIERESISGAAPHGWDETTHPPAPGGESSVDPTLSMLTAQC